ncbi:MAG: hypothetical protein ACJ8DV_20520, partial [Microvirga sp.]
SRTSLVSGLGVASFEDLLRICERKTPERQAACSLFWTLGGNQVGRAAISGWRDVIRPAMERGAALWPFDGSLAELAAREDVVLAETYPAEAYRMFNAGFRREESKRRRSDRASKASAILDWATNHSVHLSDAAEAAVRDGFGAKPHNRGHWNGRCGNLTGPIGRRGQRAPHGGLGELLRRLAARGRGRQGVSEWPAGGGGV